MHCPYGSSCMKETIANQKAKNVQTS
jgi:hypothetical protein